MQNLAPTDQTEHICNVSVTQSDLKASILNITDHFIFTTVGVLWPILKIKIDSHENLLT